MVHALKCFGPAFPARWFRPKTASLQKRLQQVRIMMVSLVLFLISVFVLLLFGSSSVHMQMLDGYQDLQDYYYSVSESTDAVKNYLINEIGDDLGAYENALQKAKESVERLQSNPCLQQRWRFSLLANMLEGYDQSARELEKQYKTNLGPRRYQYYYEDFLHKDFLIQETSTAYYHQLTESMSALKELYAWFQLACLGVCILSALLTAFWVQQLNHFFTDDLSKPLAEITEKINTIKDGQYSLADQKASSNEMQQIFSALKQMAGKVRRSIEIEKENTNLEKKLAQSELRMLQNQINPHFLFNTLNTIYCFCDDGRCEEAADMIFKTSHLLRYALEMQRRISTIAQEKEALVDYIEIQQVRKNGLIEFALDCPEDPFLLSRPIPAMVLQPLVENALLHGLKDCTGGGRIEIEIYREKNQIFLSVWDNGIGVDEKRLEQLQTLCRPDLRRQDISDFAGKTDAGGLTDRSGSLAVSNNRDSAFAKSDPQIPPTGQPVFADQDASSSYPSADAGQKKEGSLGLFNVIHRLDMFYQDHFDFELHSQKGEWFEVLLKIDLSEEL